MSAIHASIIGSCAASQIFFFNDVVSTSVLDYNVYNKVVAAGWDQQSRLKVLTTVTATGRIGSSSTSSAGYDTGLLPSNTDIEIAIESGAYTVGKGGRGGFEGGMSGGNDGNGEIGGPALRARCPLKVNNLGVIGGGGGGGGANVKLTTPQHIYGGGGGAGLLGGEKGDTTDGSVGVDGSPGTLTSGGAGGFADGQGAGNGGGLGQSGTASAIRNGGSPGAAVIGNSFITWINTGTRLGAIT